MIAGVARADPPAYARLHMLRPLRVRVVILAVGGTTLVLACVLGIALHRGVGAPALGAAQAGFSTAPSFSLVSFDGTTLALDERERAPVFLYFWASWCPPCREEAPVIAKLWPEYQARGYRFIGVNAMDSDDAARAFAKQYGMTFPLARDVGGAVYLRYGVYGLPEAFFLEPGLHLHEKYIGALTEPVLRAKLDALRPTPPTPPATAATPAVTS